MSVIIVDDNKNICELIENILLFDGYTVKSCFNPLEANHLIEEVQPKVVITDMLMSGVDGRTLSLNLKSNPKTSGIKILMMSAHPDAKSESVVLETANELVS
jgi:PleD family two-component response regulator